jgi:hypothetical protein
MKQVGILIPGSPTAAFYSQIAAISHALKKLDWQRWRPTIYACFGGEYGDELDTAWKRWRAHLQDVHVIRTSEAQFAYFENWAQVNTSIALAPRDCDAIMCLDADTLPVRNFEDILDRVCDSEAVAGVIAHYPPTQESRKDWAGWSTLINRELEFVHNYSLVHPHEPEARRLAPFYINGGVIFYSRKAFDRYAPAYLHLHLQLVEIMDPDRFSAQIAFTLAVAAEGLTTFALPMRYNFPNDRVAEQLYPQEAEEAVIHHYLRTTEFDRHQIFTSRSNYEAFLALPLNGINRRFQDAARAVIGENYPFD